MTSVSSSLTLNVTKPGSLSPDGSKITGQSSGGGDGTLITAYGKVEFGVFLAPPDSTHAGTFNMPLLNGIGMQPGGPLVGAFGYPAMMQLWIANGGNLYGVGNDQLWSQWDGYYWIGNGGISFVDGPAPTAPVPGPLPTYNPPYTPSPDNTSITGGAGSLTTIDGIWGYGTVGSSGWRIRLNGIELKDYEGSYHYFDQLIVRGRGRMFMHRADGSGWEHWALNQHNKSAGPTAAPVPIDVAVTPSRGVHSKSDPVGTIVQNIVVTTSDGSPFSGTYLLRNTDNNPVPYTISGSKILTAAGASGGIMNLAVSQNGTDLTTIFVIEAR